MKRKLENYFGIIFHQRIPFLGYRIENLVKTAEAKNAVIATGGGTPCFKDNTKWMNEHGVTVYIKLAAGSLFHRLAASKDRPLLQKER
ncbi:MAG: hypothetical protein IPK08_03965 [Bacteroidetes bacterium]|nr:hypothetical protein [Bacteroidota bacterium]